MQTPPPSSNPYSTTAKLALLPLLTFLVLFLGVGFYYQAQGVEYAFYQLPSPSALLPAVILAVLLSKETLTETMARYIEGAGHSNIITMCFIYLLAGAFSSVAKATGGVDATVSLGLSIIPAQFILPGLFLIAGFIATAMGTSMGTLAALGPVGLGVAQATGIEPALVAGVLVSGAIFGDNLSIISDTTIAATRTQGCEMRDKFKANLHLALPAAFIVIVLLITLGETGEANIPQGTNAWLALPYLLILVLAVSGVNVFAVLVIGILTSAIIGMSITDYELASVGQDVYSGFGQMQEIMILSLMLGGLSELMREQGGIDFLLGAISKLIRALSLPIKIGNSLGIAVLISALNVCIANNTVSIIVAGSTAKALAEQGGIEPKRSASLLDIFACVVQGLIPYGGQLLIIGATFSLSPVDVIPYSFYCFILAGVTLLSFVWRAKKER